MRISGTEKFKFVSTQIRVLVCGELGGLRYLEVEVRDRGRSRMNGMLSKNTDMLL